MIRFRNDTVIAGLFLSVCASPSALARQSDLRPVTVNIAVRTQAGAPLQDVPLRCSANEDRGFGFTNAEGALTLIVNVRPDEPPLVVTVTDGRWFNLTPDTKELARERSRALRTQYFINGSYLIPLTPTATDCSLEVIAQPAVTVRANLGDGGPYRPFRSFLVRGGSSGDDLDPSQPFVVPGVRQGAPTDIFVRMALRPQFHVLHFNATQTAQDINLGEIQLVDAPRTATVAVTMTNLTNLFDIDGALLWDHATLVSSDAQVILVFRVDQSSGTIVERLRAAPPLAMPLVPPGTFYVSPGMIDMPLPLALFDAVRAGRQADLDAAGVPKFTAIEGQQVTLQFDARAARDAIMAFYPPQNP